MATLEEPAQALTAKANLEQETQLQGAASVKTSEACEPPKESEVASPMLVPARAAPATSDEAWCRACDRNDEPSKQGVAEGTPLLQEEAMLTEDDATTRGALERNHGSHQQSEALQETHREGAAPDQGLSEEPEPGAKCAVDGQPVQMVGEPATAANAKRDSILEPSPPNQNTESGPTTCELSDKHTTGAEDKQGSDTNGVMMVQEQAARIETAGEPASMGSTESKEILHAEVSLGATQAVESKIPEQVDATRTDVADLEATNGLPKLSENDEAMPRASDNKTCGGDEADALQQEGSIKASIASQAKVSETPPQTWSGAPMEYVAAAGGAPQSFFEDREQRAKALSMLQVSGTPEPSEEDLAKWLEIKWAMLTDRERRAKDVGVKRKLQATAERASSSHGGGRGRGRGCGRGRGKMPEPAGADADGCKPKAVSPRMLDETSTDREAITPVKASTTRSLSPASTTKRQRANAASDPTTADSKSVSVLPGPSADMSPVSAAAVAAASPPAPALRTAPAVATQSPAASEAATQSAQDQVAPQRAYRAQSRLGRGGAGTWAVRGRGRRASPYDEPAGDSILLDEEVLRKARRCGMEESLRLLASNSAIVAKGSNGTEIMDALRKSKGLVHRAKAALLD